MHERSNERKYDVVEVSACDKADDSKGKKRKDDLVDYVQQVSGAESKLPMDLCETGEADLRDPRQVSEVDLEKLIMNNRRNN
jgi:peroxiredoxin family protein